MNHPILITILAVCVFFPVSGLCKEPDEPIPVLAVEACLQQIEARRQEWQDSQDSNFYIYKGPQELWNGRTAGVGDVGPALQRDGDKQPSGRSSVVGYQLRDNLGLELGLDHTHAFLAPSRDDDYERSGIGEEQVFEVMACIAGIRFTPPSGVQRLRPYIIGGTGMIRTQVESESGIGELGLLDPNEEWESAPSGRLGLGFDLTQGNASAGLELSYTSGFGDLADIAYNHVALAFKMYW